MENAKDATVLNALHVLEQIDLVLYVIVHKVKDYK